MSHVIGPFVSLFSAFTPPLALLTPQFFLSEVTDARKYERNVEPLRDIVGETATRVLRRAARECVG